MATLVSLLDNTDFQTHPFLIVATETNFVNALTEQIAKRQRELLIQILGNQEYYNLENDNSGAFPITQKWIDFINGVVYTKDGNNIDYQGIKEVVKKYVYYWYVRDNVIQATESGGVVYNEQNTYRKIQNLKMVQAYNEMVDLIGDYNNDIPTVFNYLDDNDFDVKMQKFNYINNIY